MLEDNFKQNLNLIIKQKNEKIELIKKEWKNQVDLYENLCQDINWSNDKLINKDTQLKVYKEKLNKINFENEANLILIERLKINQKNINIRLNKHNQSKKLLPNQKQSLSIKHNKENKENKENNLIANTNTNSFNNTNTNDNNINNTNNNYYYDDNNYHNYVGFNEANEVNDVNEIDKTRTK